MWRCPALKLIGPPHARASWQVNLAGTFRSKQPPPPFEVVLQTTSPRRPRPSPAPFTPRLEADRVQITISPRLCAHHTPTAPPQRAAHHGAHLGQDHPHLPLALPRHPGLLLPDEPRHRRRPGPRLHPRRVHGHGRFPPPPPRGWEGVPEPGTAKDGPRGVCRADSHQPTNSSLFPRSRTSAASTRARPPSPSWPSCSPSGA